MYGIRLFGIPFGSSPISPDLCAPTGLKYRSRMMFHDASDLWTSLRMCSMKSFVRPYGLVADVGNDSVTGTDAGSPYTVAELEKTRFFTGGSAPPIAYSRLTVPEMLFS